MKKKSLFIVIEGLDGLGKSTVSEQLARDLESRLPGKVMATFEPHDPSCAGLYIRQVLQKEIRKFSNQTLALAFAANRLDHIENLIVPWLNKTGTIVLCDRYYLSSMVYQTDDKLSKKDIMHFNSEALKPDIIFFLNAPNKVALERMKIRNQKKELYETNLTQTRNKYRDAIKYLKKERKENIIEIDVSGSVDSIVNAIRDEIYKAAPHFNLSQKSIDSGTSFEMAEMNSLKGVKANSIQKATKEILKNLKSEKIPAKQEQRKLFIFQKVSGYLEPLHLKLKSDLFLDYVEQIGYTIKGKVPWTFMDAWNLSFPLPGGLTQSGVALVFNENQRYDASLLNMVKELEVMADFLFAFSAKPEGFVTKYYGREVILTSSKRKASEKAEVTTRNQSLLPNPKVLTTSDLVEIISDEVLKTLRA